MGRVEVVSYPKLEEAYRLLKRWASLNRVILIVANSSVNYTGRASSTLSWGERIVIIKEDRALLVHRPKGYEPVNWQSSGSALRISMRKNRLVLESIRRRPSERLEIVMDRVLMIALLGIEDEGSFSMYGEEDLRKAVASNPDLIEMGLKVIREERRVGKRRADLVCLDKEGRMVVVELKNEPAGREAARQLLDYVRRLREETGRNDVRGILVAPRVARGVKPLLYRNGLELRILDPNKLKRYGSILNVFSEHT